MDLILMVATAHGRLIEAFGAAYVAGRFATLKGKVALLALASVGWLNTLDFERMVQVFAACFLTLVGVWLVTIERIDRRRRESRRADFEQEMAELTRRDEVSKSSLTMQLDEIQAKAADAAAEAISNQEKMRASLHEIRDDLNVRNLENAVLRRDLEESNKKFNELSEQLITANRLIAEQNARIAEQNARIAEQVVRIDSLTREVARLNSGEQDRAERMESLVRAVKAGDAGTGTGGQSGD